MNVLDTIRYLTDKTNGLGIPMQVIGRYCGCHPTGIGYYTRGERKISPETEAKYQIGIEKLIKDFKEKVEQ